MLQVKTGLFWVQDGLLPALYCVSTELQGKKKRRKRKSMFVNGAVCNALGCKIMAQGKETHTQHTEFYVGFCDGSLP